MAIKLKNYAKNLGADNPSVKVFSLFFMFLSISIFIETVGFICRDTSFFDYFTGVIYHDSWLPYTLVRQFLLFGSGVYYNSVYIFWGFTSICIVSFILTFMSFCFYKKNIKTATFFDSFIKYLNNKLPLEVVFLLVFASIQISRYGMHRELYMYDKFVFYDIATFYLIYFMINYVIYNKENLFDKLYTSHFIKTLINKHNKKSLTKKLAYTLCLELTLQCILLFVLLTIFNSRLVFIFYILITLISYIFIFKLIYKKFDYIEYISKEVESIKNGDIDCKLQIEGNGQIALLAENINNMNEGLSKAVDNAIKSEKMKTELITNVSHDLKTPLTSIINYVDMLKSDTLDDDTKKSYLSILDKKSKRLKILVEEIFEAAKLSSGEMEFNIEKTDIKELLIQSVVELDDKIQESRLDFIVEAPGQPIFAMIDGKRTFRAFENLISNITKYSAPNSRVYIDLFVENNTISITFKNISNYRLNLSPDEFLERFRRGDSSRNTEGSGLGLSITQSIVNTQNGAMDLNIDGDLFKVILQFETCE
ncbi:histidine kinase dimerization/phospho-acceptor domain-containing protein [Terrisporobacter vanillatitrophus]|uniref:sensor histidine kinase n=1 Tax=Terrisporobacter vanillatitrophus TaxID=3058402 RepID=UPI003366638E